MSVASTAPSVKQKQPAKSARIQRYHEKNDILSEIERGFVLVSPLDYYHDIFQRMKVFTGIVDKKGLPDADLRPVYVASSLPEGNRWHSTDSIENLLQAAIFCSDMAMPLGVYYQNWMSKATLCRMCAYVVDVEYVHPWQLRAILERIKGAPIKPRYINNSGNGLHLIYVLETVECYNWLKPSIDKVYRALVQWWAKSFTAFRTSKTVSLKLDKGVTPVQAYRIVGSQTKDNMQCRSFFTGAGRVTLDALAHWLKIEMPGVWKASVTGKTRKGRREMRKKLGIKVLPNGKEGFYNAAIDRMKYPETGSRFYFLKALAIIGYKSRMSEEQVETDIRRFAAVMNAKDEEEGTDNPLTEENIKAAMEGFSPRYTDLTREKINELGGWDFQKAKRNGRKQEDHLKIARASRNARLAVDKAAAIRKYKTKNPNATQKDIALALGMSRDTVRKYTAG